MPLDIRHLCDNSQTMLYMLLYRMLRESRKRKQSGFGLVGSSTASPMASLGMLLQLSHRYSPFLALTSVVTDLPSKLRLAPHSLSLACAHFSCLHVTDCVCTHLQCCQCRILNGSNRHASTVTTRLNLVCSLNL